MNPISSVSSAAITASIVSKATQLQADLDSFRERLAAFPTDSNPPAFIDAVDEFLSYCRNYSDADTYSTFERSLVFPAYQSFFANCILRFTWSMEERTFAEMVKEEIPQDTKLEKIVSSHTWGAYKRMEDTLKLVDYSTCKKFVMMGCGMVPGSLFYLNDWTNVPSLIGIDNAPDALRMASELVDKFALQRVQIVRANAVDFDYSDCDIIYWDPFARPRTKVMQRLIETAKRDSRIILREPFATGTLFMESVIGQLGSTFEVCAESNGFPGRFMLKHYLLKFRHA